MADLTPRDRAQAAHRAQLQRRGRLMVALGVGVGALLALLLMQLF